MSANNPWNARDLVTHLRETKYASDTELVDAGLAKWNKGGNDVYDLFRNRAMIPIHGNDNTIIGFHARALDDAPAKYLNSPDTPVFRKGQAVFGVVEGYRHATANNVSEQPDVVRVEGPFDAIAVTLASNGRKVGATTGGTAFTGQHADYLVTTVKNSTVYLVLDNDTAGRKATVDAYWKLTARGVTPRSVTIPGAKDPGELYQASPELLAMALASREMQQSTAVDVAYTIARTYEAGQPTSTIENTVLAARQIGQAIAVLDPSEWDETITHAAAAITRHDDTEHAIEMLWDETLAAHIEWPTTLDEAQALTPAQTQASQDKLADVMRRAHAVRENAGTVPARALPTRPSDYAATPSSDTTTSDTTPSPRTDRRSERSPTYAQTKGEAARRRRSSGFPL